MIKPLIKRLLAATAYRFGVLPIKHYHWSGHCGFAHTQWLRKNKGMTIGSNTRVNPAAEFMEHWKVRIGSNCTLSACTFVTHDMLHHSHPHRRPDGPRQYPDTVVEDGVLIGINVTIYPGVRIGQGAIISAGCVVTQDVPPWTQLSMPMPAARIAAPAVAAYNTQAARA